MDLRLREVRRLQKIKGVSFPAWIRFRQLIFTGPPGSGKTSLVKAVGGWPGEAYLDLSQNWWRSPVLSLRPREVHLGFPIRGQSESVALVDGKELEACPHPELEPERVRLPPQLWGWRSRYAFEFLLPAASEVLSRREERSHEHTHPIDSDLSPDLIREQLSLYSTLALWFHRTGMVVYIRENLDGVPMVIDEPRAETRKSGRGGRGGIWSWVGGFLERLGLIDGDVEVLESFDRLQLAGTKVRIRCDALPIEIYLGAQRLRICPVEPLQGGDGDPCEIIVFDPEAYSSGIGGFVRLEPGLRVRLGQDEDGRIVLPVSEEQGPPRLEVRNRGDTLTVVDLYSPTGLMIETLRDPAEVDRLTRDRRRRMERVRELFGGPIATLPADEALACLRRTNRDLVDDSLRPRDSRGLPGGLLELPEQITPILVGDLHANLDNLLKILCVNRFLDEVEAGQAAFILLGDAVHVEDDDELAEMDSSLLIMDIIHKLMVSFSGRFIYLRGNHDSFSQEVTKRGMPQGQLWREQILQVRGEEYLREMERFYDLLPHLIVSDDFVACHGGPPTSRFSRESLIDLAAHPKLRYQLTWNRLKSARRPGGYGKAEVHALKKALGLDRSAAMIVSHNPQSADETVWLDAGGIRQHHVLYSARRDHWAVFTRIAGRLVPLTYRGEPVRALFEAP